ncbi:MAG TPA: hypothetical protein PL193_12990 [Xanthobacteraceae bacterium]|nr:hypothetical protein [Xanthobacteraceae bacterium]
MDLNNLSAAVAVPGWAIIAGGLALVLLLILMFRPRGDGGSGIAVLSQLAVVAIIAGAAYFGLKQTEDSSRLLERKAIEDRAAALLAQSNQPGSVLGCLHVAATSTLDEACEQAIFAEPQRVASAVSITADHIALLYDATLYAVKEPAFLDRFEGLRRSLEADPYGLVAHVFAKDHKCIPDSCTRYRILKETDKVKANLTAQKFEGLLAKHKQSWVKVRPALDITNMQAMPPVNTIGSNVDDKELPSANTAVQMNAPSGLTATTPVLLPAAPNQAQTPAQQAPVANTTEQPASTPVSIPQQEAVTPPAAKQKQKAETKRKQRTTSAEPKQAPTARPKSRPEPVGGLPRVTARGTNPPADDDDDTPPAPPPSATPPAATPQQNRGPFGLFGR